MIDGFGNVRRLTSGANNSDIKTQLDFTPVYMRFLSEE